MGNVRADSSRDLKERLSAWSFIAAVEEGIRWGDLLNTAPPAAVLMKEGLVGFAEKPKPWESMRVCHGRQVDTLFLIINGRAMGSACLKTIRGT